MRYAPALGLLLASLARAEGASPVADLGSDRWEEREAAMLACLERPDLRAELAEGTQSADPEKAWRCRWVLDAMDWGIDAEMATAIGHPFEGYSRMTDDEVGLGLQLLQNWEKPSRILPLSRLVRELDAGPVRDSALTLLRNRVPGCEEYAAARLKSADHATAVSAAYTLALWGDKRGADVLRSELAEKKPVLQREEILEALVAIGEPAGLDGVLAAIREAVTAGRDPEEKTFDLLAKAPVGDPRVEAMMTEILQHDWPAGAGRASCDRAVRTLQACGGPGAVEKLCAWWAKSPDERHKALTAAAAIADGPALVTIAETAAGALGGPGARVGQLATLASLQRLAGLDDARRATLARLVASSEVPKDDDQVVEVALGLKDLGDPVGAELWLERVLENLPPDSRVVRFLRWDLSREAGVQVSAEGVEPDYNDESWHIVIAPERLVHPGLAVRLSEHTVTNNDGDAPRGTLGVAYFRAGRWEDCVRTLEKNVELGYRGKEQDLAALVMSYRKLGRHDDAAALHARCIQWESESGEPNPLRAEMDRALRDPAPPRTPGDGR